METNKKKYFFCIFDYESKTCSRIVFKSNFLFFKIKKYKIYLIIKNYFLFFILKNKK